MKVKLKKLIPYLLILIIVTGIGLFGVMEKANAQATGQCWQWFNISKTWEKTSTPESECKLLVEDGDHYWSPDGSHPPESGKTPPETPAPGTTITPSPGTPSSFEKEIGKMLCWVGVGNGVLSPSGCLVQFSYYIFYVIPAFLLGVVAYFFNILIYITLNGAFLDSGFVSSAWGITRDLSNIFFILILLYVAVKIILDLGGHDAKKMIAKVVIMALLINFSMFFTKVIIDTSNVLALVFYNKLSTGKKDPVSGNVLTAFYQSVTGEKDISGGLVSTFNPTQALGKPFFDAARVTTTVTPGGLIKTNENEKAPVPVGMMVGIILVTGLVLIFATYALFISGLSFVGRLIELFVLIIFSPFAFMSFSLPLFAGVEYIGWDHWFKRLLKTSFMAPIFMFFLYFIFMMTNENIFQDSLKSGQGIIMMLLRFAIPAVVILVLLLKATEYAKKGAGIVGEKLTKVGGQIGGMATGLALGAATGGTAWALRAGVGGVGGTIAGKSAEWTNRLAKREDNWGKTARFLGANKIASGLIGAKALAQRSSFDIRATGLGKGISSTTGIKMGEAQKGGIAQARKEKVEKRKKRADMLKVGEDEELKQELNRTEQDKQKLAQSLEHQLKIWDDDLVAAKERAETARGLHGGDSVQSKQAYAEVQNIINKKKAYKSGTDYEEIHIDDAGTKTTSRPTDHAYETNARLSQEVRMGGKTLKELNKKASDEEAEIAKENRRRTTAYANRIANWRHWGADSREAKHQIIMGSKIEEKSH